VSAQGLDVSNFSGRFDWSNAVNTVPGLVFGVFRLTQSLGQAGMNSPDPTAAWNHQQIAEHGLHRGGYHFLDPAKGGAAQAQYFVDEYSKLGLTGEDMLWLDNETTGASPHVVSACAQSFMAELDHLCPHNPRGVYTYISFAKDGNCAGLGEYPLWLAFPAAAAPVPPPPWVKWQFWQFGFRNGFDADAFNGSAQALDDWIASFAPLPPPKPAPAPDLKVTLTLPELAEGADDADLPHWLIRRIQLIANGIFGVSPPLVPDGKLGPLTKGAIGTLQHAHGLPVTGKLDTATWMLILAGA
jgi:lysozyme